MWKEGSSAKLLQLALVILVRLQLLVLGQLALVILVILHLQLVRANINRDAGATEGCLKLVEDLCATWREAALAASQVA